MDLDITIENIKLRQKKKGSGKEIGVRQSLNLEFVIVKDVGGRKIMRAPKKHKK